VNQLTGIFAADGSFRGELRYALRKLVGKESCALCDLTHGWRPWGSRQWKDACASASLEVDLLHRDQASPAQLEAAGNLPAFVANGPDGWVCVMDATTIQRLAGQPQQLIRELLDAHG